MPKHVLIAPLDWGLGHTTRCVPLIRHLLAGGHRVSAAGNESQLAFYRELFPQVALLPLGGYGVRYGRGRASFAFKMMLQIPRILSRIRAERRWLHEALQEQAFDGVISDNRYGLWSDRLPTVLLTHQLRIRTGMGGLADSFLQWLHYRLIRRFGACWVPDLPEEAESLGGTLSHPAARPPHTRYAGLLSAAGPAETQSQGRGILVLLSGPEPQRSLLSAALWEQVQTLDEPVVFIEGSESAPVRRAPRGHVRHYRRVPPALVRQELAAARVVVCRSGYSTLMDIGRIGCRAVLIPTPGQTEQEYLARRLQARGQAVLCSQQHVRLSAAIEAAAALTPLHFAGQEDYGHFGPLLDDWLAAL